MGIFPTTLVVDRDCAEAVTWLIDQMNQAGMVVLRTFDLQTTRHIKTACPCPEHGTDQCDCQMVVLMVYQPSRQPLSLVAHGYHGQTRFSVVDTPAQHPDPVLEQSIRRLFASSF